MSRVRVPDVAADIRWTGGVVSWLQDAEERQTGHGRH
jgi:hypothetical protein